MSDRPSLLLFNKRSYVTQQRGERATPLDRFGSMPSVLESVSVTLWRARRWSAVHPAAAVRHRGRLARAPFPCLRSAPRAEVHG